MDHQPPFIITVGLNCLDLVQFVAKFPVEDSDQRCIGHSWERGGNASNNSTVLSVLGSKVEYLGSLTDDHLKGFFTEDFSSYGIIYKHCPIMPGFKTGVSVVLSSEETGSRTIVHSRGTLPELTYEQFSKIELKDYSWIHFEGRNETQVLQMLNCVHKYNKTIESGNENESNTVLPRYKRKKLPVSIEIEKRIDTISILLSHADVIFIGKEYASMKGAIDCQNAVEIFSKLLPPGTLIICPWGDQGAGFGITGTPANEIVQANAYPPPLIVDSLGAGDTFIAAVIHSLSQNKSIPESVDFGCKVAGTKLGIRGFRNIKIELDKIHEYVA